MSEITAESASLTAVTSWSA
ncbi:hypothetical protein VTN00DRAFT_4566 [Thermoascus crustaceus]